MDTVYCGMPTGVSDKLPYWPSIDEILYVAGKHTAIFDRWRIEDYMLNSPALLNEFSEKDWKELGTERGEKLSFMDYIDSSRDISPSLFVYSAKLRDGRYRFQQFEIGEKGIWKTIKEVLVYMDYMDKDYGDEYEQHAKVRGEIVNQMQQCAHLLLDMKMDEDEIREILFGTTQVLRLSISRNGDIQLVRPVAKSMWLIQKEIRLSPLDKAIYFLFLRHTDGIKFCDLPDYREELIEIYEKLIGYRITTTMQELQKCVEDVTDPTKNFINKRCAHIRRAFIEVLGSYLATSYYITGNRGEEQKIILDRKYVLWRKDLNKDL